MITVVNTSTERVEGINIRTTLGTLNTGYKLTVTLQYNSQEVTVDVLNLLVTDHQDASWCIKQCERLDEQLNRQASYSPGQILRLLKCGYQPLADLGFPVPPQKRLATDKEYQEFHERTGKAKMYLDNDLHQEWAIAYNAWIEEHSELAEDYRCNRQDETWLPVQ